MAGHHWIHTEGTVVGTWRFEGRIGLPSMPGGREESFLNLLAEGVYRHGVSLYLYCLVGRRFHLLFSANRTRTTAFPHFLGSGFAELLSEGRRKKTRRLALRYRSIHGEKEACLSALSRHLHLFPLQAGVVSSPEEYRWSSYRSYIGKETVPPWLSRDRILRRYGTGIDEAEHRYRSDVESAPTRPGAAAALGELLASVRSYYRIPSITSRGSEGLSHHAAGEGNVCLARPGTSGGRKRRDCRQNGTPAAVGCSPSAPPDGRENGGRQRLPLPMAA